MPGRPTLQELETYGQEIYHAGREGRAPKYRDPREVFAENPNLDSYLVEKSEQELDDEQRDMDELAIKRGEEQAQVEAELAKNGNVAHGDQVTPDAQVPENPPDAGLTTEQVQQIIDNANQGNEVPVPSDPTPVLADPGQDLAHSLSLAQNATESDHQNTQSTPNPELPAASTGVEVTPPSENPSTSPETVAPVTSSADPSVPAPEIPHIDPNAPSVIPPPVTTDANAPVVPNNKGATPDNTSPQSNAPTPDPAP